MDMKLVEAVAAAAVRCGVMLTGWQADTIAQAVVEALHEGEYTLTNTVYPELWERQEFRDGLRKDMRRRLAIELMDAGYVPASAPHETVTMPPPSEPWVQYIRVELRIRVRKAPEFMFKVKRTSGTFTME